MVDRVELRSSPVDLQARVSITIIIKMALTNKY